LQFANPNLSLGPNPSAAVKPARKKKAAPKRSVIIVDDEISYVELVARMIADNLDCPVHPFTRPADALAGLSRISAGVIVSDYCMPQMNGVEFIKKASKLAPKAAFIMISGQNLELIEDELSELKRLKTWLQKPFGWRPLTAAVLKAWPGKDSPKFRP
jgi:DNA-binding NtrC family response regulator